MLLEPSIPSSLGVLLLSNAIQKPEESLTRLSPPHMRVWLVRLPSFPCESLACKTNNSTLPLTKSWSTYIYSLAPKKGNYPPNLEQEETAQWVPNSGNSILAFQDKTCTYQSRSVPSSSQHFCRWAIFRMTSVV